MAEHQSASIARLGVAFVFFYHGLVPKLLWMHPSEVALVEATPTLGVDPLLLVRCGGIAEIILAMTVICFWRHRWPLHLAGVALIGLLLSAVIFAPEVLVAAFNPVSLSVATIMLVWIALRCMPPPSSASVKS